MFIIKIYNIFILKQEVVYINKLINLEKNIDNTYREIDYRNDEYKSVMEIYYAALIKTKNIIKDLQKELNKYAGYEIIHDVTSRIKSYDSIINKMKKKKINFTYEELIENINDIAGIRIICMSEEDIYKIVKILSSMQEINVIKEKDYIKNCKKSGYSAYHLIVEVPIYKEDKRVWVKVEIQIKTMAMDFWSCIEHKVKYKSSKEISKRDSKKLKVYAKIISKINRSMIKMYKNNYKYIEN